MKTIINILVIVLISLHLAYSAKNNNIIIEQFANVPLSFTRNSGQFPKEVKYITLVGRKGRPQRGGSKGEGSIPGRLGGLRDGDNR